MLVVLFLISMGSLLPYNAEIYANVSTMRTVIKPNRTMDKNTADMVLYNGFYPKWKVLNLSWGIYMLIN